MTIEENAVLNYLEYKSVKYFTSTELLPKVTDRKAVLIYFVNVEFVHRSKSVKYTLNKDGSSRVL